MKEMDVDRKEISGIPIVGILTSELDLVGSVEKLWPERLARVRCSMNPFPFNMSAYYEKEMGRGLLRTWLAFENQVGQDELVRFKHRAVALENEFVKPGAGRRINIDPGLVTLHSLLLTTHKNCGHRIYLGDGVFVEMTLIFQHQRFEPFSWTYPDYRLEGVIGFFSQLRNDLKKELKS